jgi:hypothetical protein
VPAHHFIKRGIVTAFKAINQQTIQGDLLSFGGHKFGARLTRVILNCSQFFSSGYRARVFGDLRVFTQGSRLVLCRWVSS